MLAKHSMGMRLSQSGARVAAAPSWRPHRAVRLPPPPRAAALEAEEEEDVDWTEDLPIPVRRRVAALKEIQTQYDEIHREFLVEVAALAARYEERSAPLLDSRAEVVAGARAVGAYDLPDSDDADTGIPDFWLTALTNHDLVGETITERDAEVLKHLTDIRAETLTGEDAGSFRLVFRFAPNAHFSNTLLEKTFLMEDAEEMVPKRFVGTPIDWAPGKDTTQVVVKKKVQDKKLKGKAPAVVVNKTEPCNSFFKFFRTPNMPENPEELTDEELEAVQEAMDEDFELGLALKESLVPRAVLWYTGEAAPPYYDDEAGEEEYEEFEEGQRALPA